MESISQYRQPKKKNNYICKGIKVFPKCFGSMLEAENSKAKFALCPYHSYIFIQHIVHLEYKFYLIQKCMQYGFQIG